MARCRTRHAKSLMRDQRAVAALEFGLVAPPFLMLLFAVLGTGISGFYQLALDDAVRNAARLLQINSPTAATAGSFVSAVCNTFNSVAADCSTALTYSVQASPKASGFSTLAPEAMSTSGTLSNSFFSSGGYAGNVNVLVQVAYPLPFTLPYIGKLITFTGTNSILSAASVRVEPFN